MVCGAFSTLARRRSYVVNKKKEMHSTGEEKAVKVAGFLEKKSKMKVVNRWKKMWFVLDGRLLLYYKSQVEYRSLSPCRGTVNMGLAASVVPGKTNEIVISTRSHTVALRALNRAEHEIWLQALIDAMYQPKSAQTICCSKPVQHFRYSTMDVSEQIPAYINNNIMHEEVLTNGIRRKPSEIRKKSKQDTMDIEKIISAEKLDYENNNCSTFDNKLVSSVTRPPSAVRDYRFDRLHKKFSKIAVSDSSIPGRFTVTSNENADTSLLKRSASMENDLMTLADNIYESVKDSFYGDLREVTPVRRADRLKRSGSDCLFYDRVGVRGFRSEERLRGQEPWARLRGPQYRSDLALVGHRDEAMRRRLAPRASSFAVGPAHKQIKSDTDLTLRRTAFHSSSCGALWFRPDHRQSLTSSTVTNIGTVPPSPPFPARPTRSQSFLRRFLRDDPLKDKLTPKKRSVSFLRRIWKKKDKKFEVEDQTFYHTNPLLGKVIPNYIHDGYDQFMVAERMDYVPQPEPPPDYDEVNISSGSESPVMPKTEKWRDDEPAREGSPWADSWDGWERMVRAEWARACTPWDKEPEEWTTWAGRHKLLNRTARHYEEERPVRRTSREQSDLGHSREHLDHSPHQHRTRQHRSREDLITHSRSDRHRSREDLIAHSRTDRHCSREDLVSNFRSDHHSREDLISNSRTDRHSREDISNSRTDRHSREDLVRRLSKEEQDMRRDRRKSKEDVRARRRLSLDDLEEVDLYGQETHVPSRERQVSLDRSPTVKRYETRPPQLPLKKKDFVVHSSESDWLEGGAALRSLFQEETEGSCQDLDTMLQQLHNINSSPLVSNKDEEETEPDYDVPRPHASLLPSLPRHPPPPDCLPPTHFFNTFEDSLDPKLARGNMEDGLMAPDSLELEPWGCGSDPEVDSWATYAPLPHSVVYHDSLNPILRT